MRKLRMAVAALALAGLGLIASPGLQAQEAPAEAGGEFLYVFQQDLPQLLQSIAERHGLRAVIAAPVRGKVQDLRLPVHLEPLLTRLSESYDIEWFIEGRTLSVSRKIDAQTKVIGLRVGFASFERQLKASGIDPDRIALQRIGNGSMISVTAAPATIARLEQIAASLAQSQTGVLMTYRYGVPSPARFSVP